LLVEQLALHDGRHALLAEQLTLLDGNPARGGRHFEHLCPRRKQNTKSAGATAETAFLDDLRL
jgi:hypothetical protein